MKSLITFILLVSNCNVHSQIVVSRDARLDFFSEAPIENIVAESKEGISVLNLASESIYFKVAIRSFEFRKSLMQEHFNENYLESAKFPFAIFKGVIEEQVDLSNDGIYLVTVNGELNIHGVTKKYTVNAELKVSEREISANSSFPVKLEDHEIKIPKFLVKNIAEVVQVSVSALYKPDSQQNF